ncbi:hypothetical protein ACVFI8_12195 [Agarivorans sp. MS3-6]
MSDLYLVNILAVPVYLAFYFLSTHISLGENVKAGLYKKTPNAMALLVVFYGFSALSSVFIDPNMYKGFDPYLYSVTDFLIYHGLILLSLLPVFFLKGVDSSFFKLRPTRGVIYCLYFAALLVFLSLIYIIPFSIKALTMNSIELRLLLRTGFTVLPSNLATTLAVAITNFYAIFAFLFFYCVRERLSVFLKVGMFCGAISYVFTTLCFGGRDGAVFFVATMIFMYILFSSELSQNSKVRMEKLIKGVVFLSVFVVLTISVRRFFTNGDISELVWGTLGYFGQQPYVFSEAINKEINFQGGERYFPLYYLVVHGVEPEVIRTDEYQWSFGTFLSSFYMFNGMIALCLIVLIKSFFLSVFFKLHGVIRSPVFGIILILYFQFMSTGVFYFKLGHRAGNFYLLILFFVVVLLVFLVNKSRRGFGNGKFG